MGLLEVRQAECFSKNHPIYDLVFTAKFRHRIPYEAYVWQWPNVACLHSGVSGALRYAIAYTLPYWS